MAVPNVCSFCVQSIKTLQINKQNENYNQQSKHRSNRRDQHRHECVPAASPHLLLRQTIRDDAVEEAKTGIGGEPPLRAAISSFQTAVILGRARRCTMHFENATDIDRCKECCHRRRCSRRSSREWRWWVVGGQGLRGCQLVRAQFDTEDQGTMLFVAWTTPHSALLT